MRTALILAACLALAACDAPTPDPAPDTLPEPQTGSTQLRDAINEPIDKAKAVEANQASSDADRRKALEDAGG
ncbi:MAG: hypothetical protein K0M70_08060 [Arenimonas sp.]|uniref:hypothetical protein n=1 Tax=Arenimonas sp. TaxID=1872635 RepID=UPI0025C0F63E|nr:hypothetical protein [Arenimonas sp.]MBW8367795.1 hypothetical protein [Arenimonas sp.]